MTAESVIARPVLARHVRYRWDHQRAQHQLVFPEGVLVLNETGAAIVRCCDGRPLDDLIAAVSAQFPDDNPAEEITAFLLRLEQRGFLRDERTEGKQLDRTKEPNRASGDSMSSVPVGDPPAPRPYSLLAELTYRCPLKCPYCSNPLKLRLDRPELDTAAWARVLTEATGLGVVQVHFSGGEPLVRQDLAELVATARRLGLYTHLITSGITADEPRLEQLQDAGLDALQISLQDSQPLANDWLAGAASFEQRLRAVRAARRFDFHLTLNVVLHRHNLDRIEEIIRLAEEWDVDKLELAHVQYTGWAFRNRAALLPSREQVERAATVVAQARQRLGQRPEILHVLPDYFQLVPKACLHGWGRVFMTVAPDGAALPCQTAREIPGLEFPNVRDASLADIWFRAPVFSRFRGTAWMPEPCRSCDHREIDFGGCRCQAFLLTGSAAATDPVCHFSPDHAVVAAALLESQSKSAALVFRTYAVQATAAACERS